MEERKIELTVISATNLKNVTSFGGQQSSYVVAYIFPNQKSTTRVDTYGGVSPVWNAKLILKCDKRILDYGASYITLEIYSRGSFSDKIIGTASVPLPTAVSEDGKQSTYDSTCEELQVRRPSGKIRGSIRVSVKLREMTSSQSYGYKTPQRQYPHSQEYNNGPATQSYPPSTYSSHSPFYAAPAYPVSATPAYAPSPSTYVGSGAAYSPASSAPIRSDSRNDPPALTGYSVNGRTTGVNVPQVTISSEPVVAYPATGYPSRAAYPAPGAYNYPPSQYVPQYTPQYHPQQAYYPPQPHYEQPPRRHSSGSGLGFGTGLLGGALGGLLLADLFD